MQDPAGLVNAHFLRHLVKLAAEEEVNATEDVYSANGIKLIGKGTRISEGVYERIVSHKLKKPIETSIMVGEPVTPQALTSTAEMLLDSSPSLSRLVAQGAANNDGMLGIVKKMRFGDQAGSLLKVHQSRIPSALSHGMLVGLLATGMLKRLRPHDTAAMDSMIVASVFHDIGELYIDPALHIARTQPLTPAEWKQMAAHPAIGYSVLKSMSGVAPAVAELVLEHHERMDGGGYPQGRNKGQINHDGHVLAVAEALSQFVGRQREPFAYAEIALKIIPGEFSTAIIDVVAACRDELRKAQQLQAEIDAQSAVPQAPVDFQPRMDGLFKKIGMILEAMPEVGEKSGAMSAAGKKLYDDAAQRFERITRAISSSGLDLAHGSGMAGAMDPAEEQQIHLEFEATISEVRWRLVELSRRVTLQCIHLPPQEAEQFSKLVDALGAQA